MTDEQVSTVYCYVDHIPKNAESGKQGFWGLFFFGKTV